MIPAPCCRGSQDQQKSVKGKWCLKRLSKHWRTKLHKWIIWSEKASAGIAAKWQATGMSSSHLRVSLSAFCLGKNTNAQMQRDIQLHNSLLKSSGGVWYWHRSWAPNQPSWSGLKFLWLVLGLEESAYIVGLPGSRVPVQLWTGCNIHGPKHKPCWDTSWKWAPDILEEGLSWRALPLSSSFTNTVTLFGFLEPYWSRWVSFAQGTYEIFSSYTGFDSYPKSPLQQI